jgi:inositol monophosphatase 3
LDDEVQNPIAIVSMSHPGGVKELVRSKLGEKISIIQAAGSGYKIIQVSQKLILKKNSQTLTPLFQVLEGNATIYLHNTRIKKWDLCAGNAIVESVRGRMATLKDERILYTADSSYVVEDGLLVEINKNVMN